MASKFRRILNLICNTNHDLIILGDFNIDYFVPSACRSIDTLLLSYDFKRHCDFPTRIAEYSSTCIDLLITRNSNYSKFNSLSPWDPVSDQCIVSAVVASPPKQNCIEKTKRLYDQRNFDALNAAISESDWNFLSDPLLDVQVSQKNCTISFAH